MGPPEQHRTSDLHDTPPPITAPVLDLDPLHECFSLRWNAGDIRRVKKKFITKNNLYLKLKYKKPQKSVQTRCKTLLTSHYTQSHYLSNSLDS